MGSFYIYVFGVFLSFPYFILKFHYTFPTLTQYILIVHTYITVQKVVILKNKLCYFLLHPLVLFLIAVRIFFAWYAKIKKHLVCAIERVKSLNARN